MQLSDIGMITVMNILYSISSEDFQKSFKSTLIVSSLFGFLNYKKNVTAVFSSRKRQVYFQVK